MEGKNVILSDQAERDAILGYEGHQYILAGAGAGKSTILARKIASLIAEGKVQSVTRIAAITFTKKAAAELRWKIEEEIQKRAQKHSWTPALKDALSKLPEAGIGTIHAFCADILRSKCLQLHIDPGFHIASEEEAQRLSAEIFQEYMQQNKKTKEAAPPWAKILQYDNIESLSAIRENLSVFEEKYYLLEKLEPEDFPIQDEETLEQQSEKLFQEYKKRFLEILSCYRAEDEAQKSENSLGRILLQTKEALSLASSRYDFYSQMMHIEPGLFRGKGEYIKEDSPYDKDTPGVLKQYVYFFRGDQKGKAEWIKPLPGFENYPGISEENLVNEYLKYLWYVCAKDYFHFAMNYKRLRGFYFYQDLIYQCYRAVQDPQILAQVQKDFQYIFVDEYQDTDPLQTSIFSSICSKNIKLFRVGDEKQSIYSFRGADLDTFLQEKENFQKRNSGLLSKLNVNMRSLPCIVNFANLVFKNEELPGLMLPGYEPMVPSPWALDSKDSGIYATKIRPVGEKPTASDYRRSEALWIATQIEDIFREKAESVALLFPALTNAAVYLEALKERSIPVTLSGRKYYGENYPLLYLRRLLRTFLCPYNFTSLAGLLRSPLFAMQDSQIQEWNDQGFFQSSLSDKRDLPPEAADFEKEIKELREIYFKKPFYTFLQTLFHKFDFFQLASEFYYETEMTQSLLETLRYGALLDRDPRLSPDKKLTELLLRIEEMDLLAREETGEAKSEKGTVQILSYHKSKGLEFDYVFLPDLIHESRPNKKNIVLENIQGETFYRYRNSPTGDIQYAPEQKEAEEKKRRLYVAITRAKSRLYLTFPPAEERYCKGGASIFSSYFTENSGLSFLPGEFHKHSGSKINSIFTLEAEIMESSEKKVPVLSPPSGVHKRPFSALPEEKSFRFYSGTSLLKSVPKEEPGDATGETETYAPPSRAVYFPPTLLTKSLKDLSPVDLGILAHSVFEKIDLKAPSWNITHSSRLARHMNLPLSLAPEIELYANKIIKTYKDSKLFPIIKEGKFCAKEAAFSTLTGQAIGVGYIDLLVEDSRGGLYIIDYKTNKNPHGDKGLDIFAKELLETYLIPMKVYYDAVSNTYPSREIKAALYHTQSGELFFYKDDLRKQGIIN